MKKQATQAAGGIDADDVLTCLVTDPIVAILHGAADMGDINTKDILAHVETAIGHFITERGMLAKGICSGCERPYREKGD